jgi:DinB superfamily
MTPVIRRRFDILERQKRTVLSTAERFSAAHLRFQPAPDEWSVLDVLDHLIKVESASLEAVRKELPAGTPITLKDRAGALLITSLMLTPARVKVPAGAAMVLPEANLPEAVLPQADLSRTAARWNDVRQQMTDLLSSLRPEQLEVGLFRHPVSGWMNMANALRFLSAHLRHHEYQLNRLKSAIGTR